jgi:hypothetical protein
MEESLTTIKVRVDTRKLLRQIAAETGETIIDVVHRLARVELAKIRGEASPESQQDNS